VWRDLDEAARAGRRILFEGAQGVLLDVDHGTYPFVTSSNTVAGTVGPGSGMGPSAAGFVLGIVKAYTTRVGSGPFPTELDDDTGQRLGERGHEFGTVTGRKRRCGWFDAVLVRQSAAVSGVTGIALTKIDVLDGFDTVKICTGYRIGDTLSTICPRTPPTRRMVEPVYEEFEGWSGTTRARGRGPTLPAQAIKYVRRIEELIRCPVALVTGPPSRRACSLAGARPGQHRPARRARRAGQDHHPGRSVAHRQHALHPRRPRLHADDDRPSSAGGRHGRAGAVAHQQPEASDHRRPHHQLAEGRDAFMRDWLKARGAPAAMPAMDHAAMGHQGMDHAAMGHGRAEDEGHGHARPRWPRSPRPRVPPSTASSST
jgi:hypothetical protein